MKPINQLAALAVSLLAIATFTAGAQATSIETICQRLLQTVRAHAATNQLQQSSAPAPVTDSPDILSAGAGFFGPQFGPGDLYLTITLDADPRYIDLTLHGTKPNLYYQLLSTTNLIDPAWAPGEYIQNTSGAATLDFTRILANWPDLPQQMFFRAVQVTNVSHFAYVAGGGAAIEPSPDGTFPQTTTSFEIDLDEPAPGPASLNVFYTLSGTAKNGIDYAAQRCGQLPQHDYRVRHHLSAERQRS